VDTETKPARGAQVSKDERATNDSNKIRENEMAQASQPSGQGSGKNHSAKILVELEEAVRGINDAAINQIPTEIDKDLNALLNRQFPPNAKPPEEPDPCASLNTKKGAKIAPFCHTRDRALSAAKNTYAGSKLNASTALQAAIGAWIDAKNEYDFEMATAKSDLRTAVETAVEAYNDKKNDDSRSRSRYLSYTLELSVAEAVQALETSAGSAAATLAGAAGALLSAYAAFVSAINAAQAQLLTDNATAQQSFWQNVENLWDAT